MLKVSPHKYLKISPNIYSNSFKSFLNIRTNPFSTHSKVSREHLPSVRPSQRRYRKDDLITQEEALRWRDMSPRQKVVFATKQTSYTGVILAGVGLTATLITLVTMELFGGAKSEQKIYDQALKMVQANEEVKELLGHPILGFVQHSRRSHRNRRLDIREDPVTHAKKGFMRFKVMGELSDGAVNVWLNEVSALYILHFMSD